MRRLAAFCFDHSLLVLLAWLGTLLVAGAIAAGAGGSYSQDFSLPDTESRHALDLLQAKFPQAAGDNAQVVFAAPKGQKISKYDAEIKATVAELNKQPHVAAAVPPQADQVSKDGRITFASLVFDKQGFALKKGDVRNVIKKAQAHAKNGLQVELGGQSIQNANQQQGSATEFIGVLVAIVVLFVTLGSFPAVGLPLLGAFLSLGIAISITSALSAAFSIPDFAPQLAGMIGLGVGIDYGLLTISRFRGERKRGEDVREAALTAMDTAGRSVVFAGITVVIALLGMNLMGISFLRGPADAAALTVALTMISTVTLLPAMLGFGPVGRNVKFGSAGSGDAGTQGFWARWSSVIDRQPAAVALAVIVVLGFIAVPAFHMRLGQSDAGNDAPDTTTRKAYDLLGEGFGKGFNGPFLFAVELPKAGDKAPLNTIQAAIKQQKDIAGVGTVALNKAGDTAVITAYPSSAPQDEATKNLLDDLRHKVLPPIEKETGTVVSIGGSTAIGEDFGTVLSDKLPLFIGVVVGLSLLLLMIVFRSLLVPLKAAVMNLLTTFASFGVVTAIFQDGHLASALGVKSTGPIESFLPVFFFSIVFGLSMDYEVFLVSRIHEEWEKSHDARHAVRRGLAVTGKVIFAAMLIMVSVFGSFVLGDDRIIKLFGVGLASAVLIDAFFVRLMLVPAIMRMAGASMWWLPNGLARVLPRLSVEGPAAKPEAEKQPA